MNRIGRKKSREMREKGLKTRRRKREEKKAEFGGVYLSGSITIAEACRVCGISERTGKTFWKEIKAETAGGEYADN